jgi:hypothetical protein
LDLIKSITDLQVFCDQDMQPNACSIKKIKDEMGQAPHASREGRAGDGKDYKSGQGPHELQIIWKALEVGAVTGMSILYSGYDILKTVSFLCLPTCSSSFATLDHSEKKCNN